MKYVLTVLLAFAVTASLTPAYDLPVAKLSAGSFTAEKPAREITNSIRKLFLNANLIQCDDYSRLDEPDGDWWRLNAGQKFAYMLFTFQKPEGYTTGTVRIKGTSDNARTKVYFSRDTAAGGWVPVGNWEHDNVAVHEFAVPASWFNKEGNVVLLLECETADGTRVLSCDVIDIQWE